MRKVVEEHKSIVFGARLLASVAVLALAVPAVAQEANVSGQDESETVAQSIVVTGSRIDRAGFEAPTPTTVIGEAELRQGGRDNVAEVLADVPQVRFTQNPVTNAGGAGSSGTAAVDIRGLGLPRTLTLLNGRRFVGENDLTTIPFSLVRRIDVVTGGASAAWGSGAVAGVINVILDDEFTGLELSGQYGISARGDGPEHRLGAMAGVDFAGGRGNLLLAADYLDTPGFESRTSRPNFGRANLLGTQLYQDTSLVVASLGGLIRSGALAGQQFNSDGTLRPFSPGLTPVATSAFGVGGDGPSPDDVLPLTGPAERLNIFSRASYDLTDSIRLSGDVRFSRSQADLDVLAETATVTLNRNNPFVPQAVRASLEAAGQQTFQISRYLADNPVGFDIDREVKQATIALDGRLGGGWRWDAYYSHGEIHSDTTLTNLRIGSTFNEAIDVVAGPTGPVCRSGVAACVPLNLIGEGSITPAARAYAFGEARLLATTKLDVGAASLRGEPFSTWAGPVSVAVGGEIRKESFDQKVNDLATNNRFLLTNPRALAGSFSVKEAFGEILVPLANNVPLLKQLEFNGAARLSDYSTRGSIWSWKLGLTNQVIEGLRLRATHSRDIRAPNITELFTTLSTQISTITDPVTKGTYQVLQLSSGDPNLAPETSKTTTAGVVLDPPFIPGLSLSADYYDIVIRGAIAALGAPQTVSRCASGTIYLCERIVRGADGKVISVANPQTNLSVLETSGVDAELIYRTNLSGFGNIPGRMNFRVLVNHVGKLIQDDGVNRLNTVGDLGPSISVGVPRWRGVLSTTYQVDNVGIDLRARYVGGGNFNSKVNIVNGDIKERVYVDTGIQIGVPLNGEDDGRFTLFGSITNLFDRDPPLLPNPAHYDVIGRYFNAGARIRF